MAFHRPRSWMGLAPIAAMVLGLPGCGKPAPSAPGPSAAAESVGKPLTDAECLKLAEEIRQAVADADIPRLDRLIDWQAINQRSIGGVSVESSVRKEFLDNLEQVRRNGKRLSGAVVEAVKQGGSYSMIRGHTVDKRQRLLFRLLQPGVGVTYHDFILARRPDGQVKAVDIYVFLTGETISENVRRGYLQFVAKRSSGLVDRLTGADAREVQNLKAIGEIGEAFNSNDFKRVLAVYQELSPEMKQNKGMLLVRCMVAAKINDPAEYASAIEALREAFPGEPFIDLMSIDYYTLKKEYTKALRCVDRLDQAIGGDPYLLVTRGYIHLEQGDFEAAHSEFERATDILPEIPDAYWCLVSLSLREEKYDQTLELLKRIRTKFAVIPLDLAADPAYKGFVTSPPYQEWLKIAAAAKANAPSVKSKD